MKNAVICWGKVMFSGFNSSLTNHYQQWRGAIIQWWNYRWKFETFPWPFPVLSVPLILIHFTQQANCHDPFSIRMMTNNLVQYLMSWQLIKDTKSKNWKKDTFATVDSIFIKHFVENSLEKQGIQHGAVPATVLTRHFIQEIGMNTNCPLWQWIGSVIVSVE